MWSSSSTSSSTSEGSVTIKGGGGAYHPWVAWTRFHLYPNEDDPLVIKDTTSPVTVTTLKLGNHNNFTTTHFAT